MLAIKNDFYHQVLMVHLPTKRSRGFGDKLFSLRRDRGKGRLTKGEDNKSERDCPQLMLVHCKT